MIITASIVTYNNNKISLENVINSIFNTKQDVFLYIIDNSPSDIIRKYVHGIKNVYYLHNPANPGFGGAHNIALEFAIKKQSNYHFVINPDIYYFDDIISPMVEYMNHNLEVGMMMPKVLNIDGTIQYLPKLLPTPISLICRKLKFTRKFYNDFVNKYELRFVSDNVVYSAPIISGCFTLLRITAIEKIGSYDDKYFMYFEDWDLSRRMYSKYYTIYFPLVSVYHEYNSGANKSYKLFKIFIKSAFHYFMKWGWFSNKSHREINRNTLNQFKLK